MILQRIPGVDGEAGGSVEQRRASRSGYSAWGGITSACRVSWRRGVAGTGGWQPGRRRGGISTLVWCTLAFRRAAHLPVAHQVAGVVHFFNSDLPAHLGTCRLMDTAVKWPQGPGKPSADSSERRSTTHQPWALSHWVCVCERKSLLSS